MVGSLAKRVAPVTSPKLPIRTAWEIIEWGTGKWFDVREKAAATQARWESGRARFGRRFLMPYYGSGSGLTGRSLDRPIGTVPAADVWSVVDGDRMRVLTIPELRRAMAFPDDYVLEGTRAELTRQLGNAVPPPLAAEVLRQMLAA
jgi:DNA (cytosine-5)-methyltransferase 1